MRVLDSHLKRLRYSKVIIPIDQPEKGRSDLFNIFKQTKTLKQRHMMKEPQNCKKLYNFKVILVHAVQTIESPIH